jgi:tRNA-dihydrouridine synthase
VEQSLGLKEGGRAGYAMGEMVEQEEVVEETKPESSEGLSFEELRARLPKEITDDIINILVESPQALIEFAEIQTQDDVDQFNMKYGVNLALPSGA